MATTSRPTMSLRMPDDLARALKTHAFITDTPASEIICAAIHDYLRSHDHDERVRARAKAAAVFETATDKLAYL